MAKKYIIIHHSAGPRTQTAAAIKHFIRTGRPDLGGKLAYAKIIEKSGAVVDDALGVARDVAHATGFNASGIGVCVIGWFDPGHDMIDTNDPQWHALVQTCAVLCKRYKILPSNIIGHQDTFKMRGVKVGKSCPGQILQDLLPMLREKVKTYL